MTNDSVFVNDTEEFIISEILETEIQSSFIRRCPQETLQ